MSLINQMLRDLESRNTPNNAPSSLQQNIQVTQAPRSKTPMLIWSLLIIVATGGTYWAYQYSKSLAKIPPASAADNIKKEPVPATPFEQVLATPNAVANTAAPKIEPKPPENAITPPAPAAQAAPIAQATPAVQAAPAVHPNPPVQEVQPAPPIQAAPEIVAAPPVKNRPITANPSQPKQTTAKQRADDLYRQAENNFENPLAVSYKLEQALNLDPRHLKARLLLAKTLHSQGQADKTGEFLDQSLALFPDNLQFINTRAQLFLQQKNPDGALRILQRIDLANSSNETYLSLLAAAYQQLQSFTNAAGIYQKLVSVNPEKAENWLGFALAQEKLGNAKLAREAYQQALGKNTLQPSVASYVKQRLSELR